MADVKGTVAAATTALCLGGWTWWLLRTGAQNQAMLRFDPEPQRPHPPGPPAPVTGRLAIAPAAPARDDASDFPVLHSPSRAGTAPWRLPSAPSQHGITADCAALEGLQVRAASVIGPAHRGRGVPRQDAFRLGQDSAGRHLLAAVVDGMSDSRHSDVGANVAAAALVAVVREALDADAALEHLDAEQIFLAVAGQMYRAAKQRDWDADDVRSVAVVAVVPTRPDARGHRRVWLAAIGDASAWQLRRGAWHRLIGDEKEGLDAGTVAAFLPHDPSRFAHGFAELATDGVLALTTDGVADAFTSVPDGGRWFAERWRRPPPIADFLLHVGFEQAQMQDDRTAVVVWCTDGRRTP
ncbi:protein phosphatase 2C domain-containing protein [Streptomyces sp. NPDC041068]|uniref:protein phosphatase 2C domain-containing protein n=1 Tax=Streptomyces sp. NPDC041068 TaxID=3155130 RepID=UPI0033FB85B0